MCAAALISPNHFGGRIAGAGTRLASTVFDPSQGDQALKRAK
jgi:hypothetical protein